MDGLLPLQGVRVVEMAGIGPGPYACMLLADLGAQVVRFERPEGVDAVRRDPVTTRGRAATHFVNLKQPEGVAAVLDEVARADVLVEGFRPGVMERLGLGPAECAARNPALVYGRMTGWGQDGPLARTAGHDINYIALAGVLHAIGPKDGKPVVPLNLVGDFGGGAMFLVFGVLAALVRARASGQGAVVDAAMVDGAISLMAMIMGRIATGHWRDGERGSNSLDGGTPWYDTYATADGRHFAVGANERAFYDLLCATLGLTREEAAWRDDRACWPQLARRIGEAFAARSRDAWAEAFAGSDACASPVLTLAEAAAHPHNAARAAIVAPGGVAQPAAAPRFAPLPAPAAHRLPRRRVTLVACHHAQGSHRIACHEWGLEHAPAVVCVHGLSRNARDFDALAQALAGRWRVVALDMPGRGDSDWLDDAALHRDACYMASLRQVLDRQGLRQVHWVGTSMGGVLGMRLAASEPSRVASLVLNDIGAELDGAELARLRQEAQQSPRFDGVADAEAWMRRRYAAFGPLADERWRAMAETGVEPDPAGTGLRLRMDPRAVPANPLPATVDLWSLWRAVRCPALVLRGAQSRLLSRATCEAMAAGREGTAWVEVDGAGHAPDFSLPAVLKAAAAFIESQPPVASPGH